MNLEKKLYALVDNIDVDNGVGIGVHESSFIECRFPTESYGYRVYHKFGYCFDITREKQYDEKGKEIDTHYEYIEGLFDGFKTLTIEEAIDIIESEGVFI